jgi:hypothetical protein
MSASSCSATSAVEDTDRFGQWSDYAVPLGDYTFEMHSLPRILLRHSFKVLDEGFLTISNLTIVLNVDFLPRTSPWRQPDSSG